MKAPTRRTRRIGGVTLLELMIAVAILGILTAIALPAYRSYRLKVTRNIGTECVIDAQNRMERYFARNGRYPDPAATPLIAIGYPDEPHNCDAEGLYVLTIEIAGNASFYQLRARATGRQVQDGNVLLIVTPASVNPAERLLKQHETPAGVSLPGWNFQPGQ